MKTYNIIGKGFIAKSFFKINKIIKKSNYIIYAAGISNSKTNSKKALFKEIKLFKKFTNKNYFKKLVFISTADINNNLKKKDSYIKNKIKIENIIKKRFSNYIILRLPQIIGNSKNKNTLINYFYQNIRKGKYITVYSNIKRNVLDIDDVIKVLKILLFDKKIKKKTLTISNKYSFEPIDLVKIIEKKLNKKAKIQLKKGIKQKWRINNMSSTILFNKANVSFDKNYLLNKINKYF